MAKPTTAVRTKTVFKPSRAIPPLECAYSKTLLYGKTKIVSKLHHSLEASRAMSDSITTDANIAPRITKGPQLSEY